MKEETNNLEKLKEKPVIVYNSDKHDMCTLWIIYLIFPFLSCMIKILCRKSNLTEQLCELFESSANVYPKKDWHKH